MHPTIYKIDNQQGPTAEYREPFSVFYKNTSHCGTVEANMSRDHEVVVSIPGLASGLRIWHCRKLCCRLQTWLRSGVAVAEVKAGNYSSDWTPSLGTPICHRYGPKKTNDQKKKNQGGKKCYIYICHWITLLYTWNITLYITTLHKEINSFLKWGINEKKKNKLGPPEVLLSTIQWPLEKISPCDLLSHTPQNLSLPWDYTQTSSKALGDTYSCTQQV